METGSDGSKAILVVSFGTSYPETRKKTIDAIENEITGAFPEHRVLRAFTSGMIIKKLLKRDGVKVDNVTEALERAVCDGVKALVVQPTHLMDGIEYGILKKALKGYGDKFEQISLGEPLLMSDRDFDELSAAIVERTSSFDDGRTAMVFMGHGTEASSNADYEKLQEILINKGFGNYYIGTVEAAPSIMDIVEKLRGRDYKRVVIYPLMVVAGDHANHDMAGDWEDSWKSILEKEGYKVEPILEGLGELPGVRAIYARHVREAMGFSGNLGTP